MKKIDRTITRDLQLVDIQAWFAGYMSGFKKWLGWSYSDSIFYIHDGHVDLYRIPGEYLIVFRNKVLAKLEKDRLWFVREGDKTAQLVEEIYDFFNQASTTIQLADNKHLDRLYKKYYSYIKSVMGPFIMAYWLPNWFDKDPKFSKRFSREISLSMAQRKKMEQIFPKGAVFINMLMARVAKQLQLADGLEWFISREELTLFLLDNNLPSKKVLGLRKKGFIFSKKGIILVGSSPQALKKAFALLGYEYDSESNRDAVELKGQIACNGVATGKVRIIMRKQDIQNFIAGEILVASMTTPEYLPAMKKSLAVITDEGGITCHAAIVAREMKKPCIIGTKISTKILHDGDLVEVDADNGVIKIIKLKN